MNPFSLFADLLFPKSCVGCTASGTYLCVRCTQTIAYFPLPLCPGCAQPISTLSRHPQCKDSPYLHGLWVLGKHEGILQNLIKHIKYYGHSDMVATATHLLASCLPQALGHIDTVTWVPLHPNDERQRGYNQSALLAKHLGKYLDIPARRLLVKTRVTRKQAGLPRAKRLHNVEGAFDCTTTFRSSPTILLIDDVTTTRATLNECARVLKNAGAHHVVGVVLAHGK